MLILASSSPRRKAILEQLQVSFSVRSPSVDETPTGGEGPPAFASRMAREKVVAVSKAVESEPATAKGPLYCLGADTVVTVDGLLLGKPRDDQHARDILQRLSERVHWVVTAVALATRGSVIAETAVTTEVTFRALSHETIERYVATGEGADKAGSYGIQGLGAGLVQSIAGSYSNVVGLPAAETLDMLFTARVLKCWP